MLLGIDIGTSGTKTVLFSSSGQVLAQKTVEYPMAQPQNGWAEQHPNDWWGATVQGIQAVLAEGAAAPQDIKGIGLSGQMHGLVMLNAAGEVLRPAIIWCDQRTAAECEQMEQALGKKRIIELSANPPMTGFTAAKILWVQNNQPEIYEKCAHILLPKDYIRYMLTGEFATEVSDASGMQLMHIEKRCWSSELLTAFNIDAAMLPKMHESPDVTGKVHAAAAALTGLAEGTVVVGGAGDNPAAAVGTGVVAEGSAFTTIGSSAVVYAVSKKLHVDLQGRVHGLCASVPGMFTVMSCTQAAGLSLKWLRDTCCGPEMQAAENQGVDPYVIMDKLAADVPIGAEKLLFLPYLMGERSPHPDPDCRGVFFGLSAMHTRAHLIRAVMEGVAFSQRECVDVFSEMGLPLSDMTICGGGSRSQLWRQMLADLYSCPVNTLANDQGAALGAALLAGVGTGVFSSVGQAAEAAVQKNPPQPPNAMATAQYAPYFALYKTLYTNLAQSFATLAGL